METMTGEQAAEILTMLIKALLRGEIDLSMVPRDYAQEIIKSDPALFGEKFMEFLREVSWALGLTKRIATVDVAGTKRFVISEYVVDANVVKMSDAFQRIFSNFVETDVEEAIVAISQLEKNAMDSGVFAALGSRGQIKMAYLFALLKKGKESNLLVDGTSNFAFVADANGRVWVVCFCWIESLKGWGLDAWPIDHHSGKWIPKHRVVSMLSRSLPKK